jgi:hypothetical protein
MPSRCPCCVVCRYPCPYGGPFKGYVSVGDHNDDTTGIDGSGDHGPRVHDLGDTHQPDRPEQRSQGS